VVNRSHDTIPKGQIITSVPQGSAPPDSTVKLVVSSGPPLIVVPEVSGRSYDQAVARLREAGFGATRVEEFSDTIPIDKVIRTQPEAGQRAPKGSAVSVVVSKGPDLVIVPDFNNRTISESTGVSEQAGVEIQASGVIGRGRRVRAQDPPAGAVVKRGTVVTIFF
jgi:serine/threonine-protein kinase